METTDTVGTGGLKRRGSWPGSTERSLVADIYYHNELLLEVINEDDAVGGMGSVRLGYIELG